MKNIKLTIEYDGTNYSGWQKQPNANTIQEEIEKAIEKAIGEKITIIGAGRTDSGVHGKGQVANFITDSSIPGAKFKYAINRYLPEDITIIGSKEVEKSFHSRYDSLGKKYKYLIYNAPIKSPLLRNYTYYVPYKLDFQKMNEAKDYFIGKHDFAAFMASGSDVDDTVRNIYYDSLNTCNNIIVFEIYGDGFLYNMVRIIVGTLVDVGIGKISPQDIIDILKSRDRKNAGHTAPPEGLYLEKVCY